jgi:hypothetical protein
MDREDQIYYEQEVPSSSSSSDYEPTGPDDGDQYDNMHDASQPSSPSTDTSRKLVKKHTKRARHTVKLNSKKVFLAPPDVIEPILSASSINTTHLLASSKLLFTKRVLTLLNFTSYVLPPKHLLKAIPSNVDIKSLLAWGVVTQVTSGLILNFMHAFTVPKTIGGARFICHPAKLNKQKRRSDCAAEGLSMAVLLKLLAKHFSGCLEIHCLESDFVNFFPQLDIPPHLRPYFGLWVAGVAYWLNSICQGWSRSTTLAQAISWVILTYGHGGLIKF